MILFLLAVEMSFLTMFLALYNNYLIGRKALFVIDASRVPKHSWETDFGFFFSELIIISGDSEVFFLTKAGSLKAIEFFNAFKSGAIIPFLLISSKFSIVCSYAIEYIIEFFRPNKKVI